MAAPTLVAASTANQTSAGTSHAINLPATVSAGNRLVCIVGMNDNPANANTFSWPAGWTELFDQVSLDLSVSAAWKIADGTEGGTTVTVTSTSTEKVSGKSWCFSGAGTVYATAGSISSTANPNPPSLTPAGGSGDYHWIAVDAHKTNNNVSVYPTGYSNTGVFRPNVLAGDDCTLAWGTKTATSVSSEDPSAFTISSAIGACGVTFGVIASVPTIDSIDDASPVPGQEVTVSISGFGSAPNSANSTYHSVAQTLDSADTSTVTLTWPALSTFVDGGTHATTRWNTNYTLTLGNGSESANYTVQTANPALTARENDFDTRAGTQYYAPAGSADGDEIYVTWHQGGGVLSAAGSYFLPDILPARGQIRWFDVSLGTPAWQALAYTDFFNANPLTPWLSKSTHVLDQTTYQNLLTWSNEFGHVSWTKTRCSAVFDSATETHRTTGVWTLVEDGTASNTHYFEKTITPAASTVYTAYAVVKASNRTQAAIGLTGAGNSDSITIFDLSTGAFVATSGVAPTGYSITEMEASSGWYRIAAYWTTSSTAAMGIRVYAADSGSVTFSGASQESIFVADAQIETGDTCNDYIHNERISLTSAQVYVRSQMEYNLVAYSNDMSNAAWTKTRSSISGSIALTAAALNGYQGESLYRLLEDATASSTHFVANTADGMTGNPADLVSLRFLAQGDGTRNWVTARVYGDSNSNYFEATIDLSDASDEGSAVGGTGSYHSMEATLIDTVSSRPVYEVIMRGWPTTTSDTAIYQVEFYNHNGTSTSYNGTGSNGIYIGKVQIVSGYTLPDYEETTTATQPFAGTINAATINGVAASVSDANRIACVLALPDIDEFDDAGTHAATRWSTAQDVVFGDGVTDDTGTLTFEPYYEDQFGTVAASFSASSPTGTAEGDDCYIQVISGTGTAIPSQVDFTASSDSTVKKRVYDVTGAAWLPYFEATYNVAVGGGAGGAISGVVSGLVKDIVYNIAQDIPA